MNTVYRTVQLLIVLISLVPTVSTANPSEPIRIGTTLSFSGKYSEPSTMIRYGYLLWEKQVNQRGGILNRPVELVIYDDRSNPDTTYQQYMKLIKEDRVDLLLSPYGTPLTLKASEVSEAQKMVMLASAASGKAIWNRGYRYIFGMYALADRYFISLFDLMARKGLDSVSIIYEDSPFNIDVADGAEKWAERFGISVSLRISFGSEKGISLAAVQPAVKANAHGLIVSGYPPDSYKMIDLMQKLTWRPKVLAMTIAPIHPDFYRNVGPFAEGIFAASQWEPDERIPFPGTEKFLRDFRVEYGKLPSYHAGSAYAGCQILERAINDIKALDHEQIRDYISALDTVTVIGRFKVDYNGKQVGHNPILIQWQKGKKEIVYPAKMRTAMPLF